MSKTIPILDDLFAKRDDQRIVVLRQVAHHLLRTRDMSGAEAYLSRALLVASSEKAEEVVAVYCDLGNLLTHKGDLEGALAAYEQASALAGSASGYFDRARVLCGLGRYRYARGDWHEAHSLYDEALKSEEGRTGKCYALLNLAVLFCDRGQYQEAYEIETALLHSLIDLQDEVPYNIVRSNMLYKYAVTRNDVAFDSLMAELDCLLVNPSFRFLRYDVLDSLTLHYLLHGKLDSALPYLDQLSALIDSGLYDTKRGWYIVRHLMWLRHSKQPDVALRTYSPKALTKTVEPLQRAFIHNELALSSATVGDTVGKARSWGRALHLYRKLGFCQAEIDRRHEELNSQPPRIASTRSTVKLRPFDVYIGQSESVECTKAVLDRLARTDVTILLQGESGTGKTLVARIIHDTSDRKHKAFIRFDCPCNDEGLVESLLFGHRRGAFTGALDDRVGLVQMAEGGTLFIDEIGELPLAMQSKLLTLLEEGEYRAVGSNRVCRADVRFIIATNRWLETEVADKRFRDDLYYRLSTCPVVLEPLRERREDIPLLARSALAGLRQRYGSEKKLSDEAMWSLQEREWPGNVRQLKKVVERGYLLAEGEVIEVSDMRLGQEELGRSEIPTLDRLEREHIRCVLSMVQGNKSRAARLLGIRRTTLYSRMEALGLVQ